MVIIKYSFVHFELFDIILLANIIVNDEIMNFYDDRLKVLLLKQAGTTIQRSRKGVEEQFGCMRRSLPSFSTTKKKCRSFRDGGKSRHRRREKIQIKQKAHNGNGLGRVGALPRLYCYTTKSCKSRQ